jgi:hypothetical protein
MEQAILKLVEQGWNVANGSKSPIAWKDVNSATENDLSTASLIMEKQESKLCEYTNSIAYSLNFPKEDLKALLSKHKCLPTNYSELEMTAKFINV